MKPEVLRELAAELGREFANRVNDGGGAEALGFVLVLTGLPVVQGGHVGIASNLPDGPAGRALGLAADQLARR